jgi:hypothetical protein
MSRGQPPSAQCRRLAHDHLDWRRLTAVSRAFRGVRKASCEDDTRGTISCRRADARRGRNHPRISVPPAITPESRRGVFRASDVPRLTRPTRVTLTRCRICGSFCGKAQPDVRKLIAGPTAFICDECVDVCADILTEEHDGRGPNRCEDVCPGVGGAMFRLGTRWLYRLSVGAR